MRAAPAKPLVLLTPAMVASMSSPSAEAPKDSGRGGPHPPGNSPGVPGCPQRSKVQILGGPGEARAAHEGFKASSRVQVPLAQPGGARVPGTACPAAAGYPRPVVRMWGEQIPLVQQSGGGLLGTSGLTGAPAQTIGGPPCLTSTPVTTCTRYSLDGAPPARTSWQAVAYTAGPLPKAARRSCTTVRVAAPPGRFAPPASTGALPKRAVRQPCTRPSQLGHCHAHCLGAAATSSANLQLRKRFLSPAPMPAAAAAPAQPMSTETPLPAQMCKPSPQPPYASTPLQQQRCDPLQGLAAAAPASPPKQQSQSRPAAEASTSGPLPATPNASQMRLNSRQGGPKVSPLHATTPVRQRPCEPPQDPAVAGAALLRQLLCCTPAAEKPELEPPFDTPRALPPLAKRIKCVPPCSEDSLVLAAEKAKHSSKELPGLDLAVLDVHHSRALDEEFPARAFSVEAGSTPYGVESPRILYDGSELRTGSGTGGEGDREAAGHESCSQVDHSMDLCPEEQAELRMATMALQSLKLHDDSGLSTGFSSGGEGSGEAASNESCPQIHTTGDLLPEEQDDLMVQPLLKLREDSGLSTGFSSGGEGSGEAASNESCSPAHQVGELCAEGQADEYVAPMACPVLKQFTWPGPDSRFLSPDDLQLCQAKLALCHNFSGRIRSDKSKQLEDNLAACKGELEDLLGMPVGPSPGKTAASSEEPWGRRVPDPATNQEDLIRFSQRLEQLIAESLECSCDRDVPGAMDIFKEASATMELVAGRLDNLRSEGAPGSRPSETKETESTSGWRGVLGRWWTAPAPGAGKGKGLLPIADLLEALGFGVQE